MFSLLIVRLLTHDYCDSRNCQKLGSNLSCVLKCGPTWGCSDLDPLISKIKLVFKSPSQILCKVWRKSFRVLEVMCSEKGLDRLMDVRTLNGRTNPKALCLRANDSRGQTPWTVSSALNVVHVVKARVSEAVGTALFKHDKLVKQNSSCEHNLCRDGYIIEIASPFPKERKKKKTQPILFYRIQNWFKIQIERMYGC